MLPWSVRPFPDQKSLFRRNIACCVLHHSDYKPGNFRASGCLCNCLTLWKAHLSWNLLAPLLDKKQLTVTITRNTFSDRTGSKWQIDTSTNLFFPCTLLFAANGSLIFIWVSHTYKRFGNLEVITYESGFDYVGLSVLPMIIWFKSHPKGYNSQNLTPRQSWVPKGTQAAPSLLLTLLESLKCFLKMGLGL